jgi:hypothetical protein
VLCEFVEACAKVKYLSNDFKEQVTMLYDILSTSAELDDPELTRRYGLKTRLLSDKSNPFMKTFTVLPTGMKARSTVTSIFAGNHKDHSFNTEIASLETLAKGLPPLTVESCCNAGVLVLPNSKD